MNPFNETEKKFSIGVPVYGETAFDLPKFFHHMNEQEYKNFEVVVTFDGKHAKGEKIVKEEIKKYPKMEIKYQTIEHGGCTVARNACVDLFTGDYYIFAGGDYYFYPEALRIWANAFDEHPEVNRVWGLYDIVDEEGNVLSQVGQVPHNEGKVWYECFKYSPYCDAAMPIRAEYFIPWDPKLKSLNDWDWSIRHLMKTDFKGDDHLYIPHRFYSAAAPRAGGLSSDSHTHWQERKKYIQEKNGIKTSDIVVTSLGAPNHAIPISKTLEAEYLTMPSFKDHNYKLVYLLGFYTREDPQNPGFVTRSHMDVFEKNKGKNVIHWIGTDIFDLYWHDSFMKLKALREWFEEKEIIHLCECEQTQKELKEIGIEAKIVPIPPKQLFTPLPLPEKFTVGVYLPGRDLYFPDLIMDVVRAMPDVQFYFFGDETRQGEKGENWEQLGYIDFSEWMDKFSCNLRVTLHDGLPLTPLQFLTAGRNVVSNFDLKGGIKVDKDKASIIKGIREAQKKPLDLKFSSYWLKELDVDKYVKKIRGLM